MIENIKVGGRYFGFFPNSVSKPPVRQITVKGFYDGVGNKMATLSKGSIRCSYVFESRQACNEFALSYYNEKIRVSKKIGSDSHLSWQERADKILKRGN